MLEETLQIAHQMFEGGSAAQGALDGRQFHATRLLNSPQSISRPRVPIMIGGGGEQKTLRLVAQYADAGNVFGGPEAHRPQAGGPAPALRGGRPRRRGDRALDPPECPRQPATAAAAARPPDEIIERFGELGDAGAQHILFSLRDVWQTGRAGAPRDTAAAAPDR